MPSADHELPIALLKDQPALAPELLQAVSGIKPPEYEHIGLGSDTFTDNDPTEYRADTVVILGEPKRPDLAIVVENQLRPDPRKRFVWPVYLSTLRARRECPVTLLVLCPDKATSAWCRAPIETGHEGWALRPWVLNLAEAPAVVDVEKARALPELAILSTPANADGPHRKAVLTAFAEALEVTDHDRGSKYHDYVRSKLSVAARHCLEEIMQADVYEWQSDFARKHIAEGEARGEAKGKAEGKAEAVLDLLKLRGLTVDDESRQRIVGCTDLKQVEIWFARAAFAQTLDEVFD